MIVRFVMCFLAALSVMECHKTIGAACDNKCRERDRFTTSAPGCHAFFVADCSLCVSANSYCVPRDGDTGSAPNTCAATKTIQKIQLILNGNCNPICPLAVPPPVFQIESAFAIDPDAWNELGVVMQCPMIAGGGTSSSND